MSDTNPAPATPDYAGLGYVANPFPPIDESSTDKLWMRLVTRAASNGLLAAVLRASSAERSRPVLVNMAEDVPDYYYRAAQNHFLSRTSSDSRLEMMTLNIPLDMMRQGRIRGTLTELAELVAAVDLSATISAYLGVALRSPIETLPEFDSVTAEELEEAADALAADPAAAVRRFLGTPEALAAATTALAEDDALHEAYLRGVGQEPDPEKEQEAGEEDEAPEDTEPAADAEPVRDADEAMRDYILAHVRHDLSPVIARALAAYRAFGDSIVAQELKVTKAPRKTVAALLRFMSSRWKTIVVIYDTFDSWGVIDHKTRLAILASLTELRWIIGETGVMGLAVVKGRAVELEEQFAGAEQVDWAMPELAALYAGDFAFDADRVQRWLDAASIAGVSAIKADGPRFAPLVEACENDIQRFALMAEAVFRDAALRGLEDLDDESVEAGLRSCRVEDPI